MTLSANFWKRRALMIVISGVSAVLPMNGVGEEAEAAMEKQIKPLLQEYCFDCHNPQKQKGDLNLVEFTDNPRLYENRELWEKVAQVLADGDMPPEKKPQPSESQRDQLVQLIEGQLAKFDCNIDRNPGRVTIRRLNKEEYRNTIRELLAVEYQPENFPADEVGYGFDNIGDVLSLSPMLMEKFFKAAEEIVAQAIVTDPKRIASDAQALPVSHRRLITRMPEPGQEHAAAAELLAPFLQRAYRRPVTRDEVNRLVRFVDLAMEQKASFLEGMQIAVQAALCSPHFLFRWELDESVLHPGEVRQLNDWEVASRLAYFLWSSMPDDELFALAEKGELRKGSNFEKQIARMLKDGRARAFVSNFAGQWLQIRNLAESSPDPDAFPKWKDELKALMREETEQFFAAIVKEDRPVTDLLDADFTFLNEKLARFYGITGVTGEEFRRVPLPPDSPRGGVLTQGSVLVSTSTPTRTAPVIRGKWILEQILGTPPPPPPPDVPPLVEQRRADQTASLRQRLEQHRASAECASCHAKMDPLGFALENFDATGAWRDTDGAFPIDASGKMPGGITFRGPEELKSTLKQDKRFVHTLATKMMTYALGRGLEYYDRCAVDTVVQQMAGQGNRFSALVSAIVTSDPFLKRKRDGEPLAKN